MSSAPAFDRLQWNYFSTRFFWTHHSQRSGPYGYWHFHTLHHRVPEYTLLVEAANERVVELDKRTVEGRFEAQNAMATRQPILTPRIRLVQETDMAAYGVILVYPGTRTSVQPDLHTNSVAQIVVRIPQFLQYAFQDKDSTIYLYDATDAEATPEFLGAVKSEKSQDETVFHSLPEVSIQDITTHSAERYFQASFEINGRRWKMVQFSDSNDEEYVFVILAGTLIFAGSVCFACWFHSHLSRLARKGGKRLHPGAQRA
jgi:hypothetical protein